MMAPLQLSKSALLGKAKWKDPERRQSIKDDSRVKMEWRLRTPLHIMKCWVPLLPARPCLLEAMEQVERLLQERTRAVWDGENTSPGCSYDVAMHGRSVNDAQPAVIFCSPSRICRRNAANIIVNEDIVVDPRGIGMEYYNSGPEFYAGPHKDIELVSLGVNEAGSGMFSDGLAKMPSSSKRSLKSSSGSPEGIIGQGGTPAAQPIAQGINGSLISVHSMSCTLGGMISIDGVLYGLTVAHAFERDGKIDSDSRPTPAPVIQQRNGRTIGSLLEKRYAPVIGSERERDLDWAICSLDRTMVHLTNSSTLPDGTVLHPTQIALQNPPDTDVWVNTGTTGLVKGFLNGAYSLVALPGSRKFQRMWIVVLDRLIRPGDCGSWVIDSADGTWYGQIVAAKLETAVAYVVLARDIFRDIRDQFGGQHVRLPNESDFVNETLSVVKQELSLSGNAAQSSSQQTRAYQSVSSNSRSEDAITSWSLMSNLRPSRLTDRFSRGTTLQNLTTSVDPRSYTEAREAFQHLIFQDPIGDYPIEDDRKWYLNYLENSFREHFNNYISSTLSGVVLETGNVPLQDMATIYKFLAALAQYLLIDHRDISICKITDHLINGNCNLFKEDDNQTNIHMLIVMAMGWLTMSMPYPTSHPTDGSNYEGRDICIHQQDLEDLWDYPLSRLLKKFNLFEFLLDPTPLYMEDNQNHRSRYFMTSGIRFHTLRELADIEICWTEQLPLHLKLNKRRRTLTLFAFPSFARIQCRGKSEKILDYMLQNLFDGRPTNNPSAGDLCREILLSYRLIFGLHRQSYKLFNLKCAKEMQFTTDFDPLLRILCGQQWDSPSSKPIYEEILADFPASFYLTSEFPLLGHRLFELHDFVQTQHPQSWRSLWHDKRDPTRWLTFWAVLIIGGSTILLGCLQTIFQIWQVVLTQKQLSSNSVE